MRRLLSILLLAMLVVGPAISAIPAHALSSGWTGKVDESRLPACCRRNGRHHCAMGAMARGRSGAETTVGANDPCPFAPQALAATAATVSAVLQATAGQGLLASQLCVLLAAAGLAVLASRRTQPKRGPPFLPIV